ncbi:MAG: ferredoxin-thioredoxin reductase catalytic domain-containing protein [Spirochaetota bacterium]
MTDEAVAKLEQKLLADAKSGGYFLNPDAGFVRELVESLLINEERYGYQACPCRLASGKKKDDLDIICPCDYRDADVSEFGACYCALYVSLAISKGEMKAQPIPERRRPPKERKLVGAGTKPAYGNQTAKPTGELPLPVWRCKVCGYLCAREAPPDLCPICKAKKERFERFM